MKISVLICTRNNCESIRDTLNSLLKQQDTKDIDYEVLVIDNNSTDRTRAVVEDYIGRSNGRLHYIFEKQTGQPFARNKGIRESKGEIIAFTDDDCIPSRDYIHKIFKTFKGLDEDVEFVGGKINYRMKSFSNCFFG